MHDAIGHRIEHAVADHAVLPGLKPGGQRGESARGRRREPGVDTAEGRHERSRVPSAGLESGRSKSIREQHDGRSHPWKAEGVLLPADRGEATWEHVGKAQASCFQRR